MRNFMVKTRPLLLLMVFATLALGELAMLRPSLDETPIPERPRAEYLPHVIEAGKAYADIASVLTTLSTGLFVIVALAVPRWARRNFRPSPSEGVVLAIFGLSIIGGFYFSMQAKLYAARGILLHQLDNGAIEHLLGMQAWCSLLAGLCAVSLAGEVFLGLTRGAGEN